MNTALETPPSPPAITDRLNDLVVRARAMSDHCRACRDNLRGKLVALHGQPAIESIMPETKPVGDVANERTSIDGIYAELSEIEQSIGQARELIEML